MKLNLPEALSLYQHLKCENIPDSDPVLIIDADSKVHGANMGPNWVLAAPDGTHVGPMNLAIRRIHFSQMIPYDIKYLCNITRNWCSGHVASPQRSPVGTLVSSKTSLIARLIGTTWGPSGADRTQVGPMLAPWTLLSGIACCSVWYFQCDWGVYS